jgi:hypothetical protein
MGTPIGQERYNAMLNQFATSMNETANAEVARALLDATDPQQTWLQRHGQLHMEDLMNYLRWDLFIFGALQKNPNNPLEVINQRVNSMMKAYGGRANTIIMSEDLEMYAQLVPANKTEYWLGGQEAVNRVNGKGPGVDRNTGAFSTPSTPCATWARTPFTSTAPWWWRTRATWTRGTARASTVPGTSWRTPCAITRTTPRIAAPSLCTTRTRTP